MEQEDDARVKQECEVVDLGDLQYNRDLDDYDFGEQVERLRSRRRSRESSFDEVDDVRQPPKTAHYDPDPLQHVARSHHQRISAPVDQYLPPPQIGRAHV